MTSRIATQCFLSLGATKVHYPLSKEPTTEEEFLQITYEPTHLNITWNSFQQEYQNRFDIFQKNTLRAYRDILLAKTDWVMTSDVFSTLANKEEWITYRQALRDLPAIITEYIWKGDNYEALDLKQMNIPQAPPVLRT